MWNSLFYLIIINMFFLGGGRAIQGFASLRSRGAARPAGPFLSLPLYKVCKDTPDAYGPKLPSQIRTACTTLNWVPFAQFRNFVSDDVLLGKNTCPYQDTDRARSIKKF